jgi:hypothetical protein
MSYTGSKAQTGNQTTLGIGATPVLIGEITNLSQSGKQNATDDTTNLQSVAEEFLATLLKPGKWDVTYNRVSGDAGQVALLAAFNTMAISSFTVQLPKTGTQTVAGDKYVFNALVDELDDISDVKPDKKITSKAALKVSGGITFTAGS